MKLDILILVAQLPKPLRKIIIYSKKVSSREQNSYIRIDKPAGYEHIYRKMMIYSYGPLPVISTKKPHL
jgi:hypothetical protein